MSRPRVERRGLGIGVRAQPLSCADRPAPNSCRSQIQGASSLLPAAPWLSARLAPCTDRLVRGKCAAPQAGSPNTTSTNSRNVNSAGAANPGGAIRHNKQSSSTGARQIRLDLSSRIVDLPRNPAALMERNASARGTRKPYLCAQSTAADLSRLPMRNTQLRNVICPASFLPIRLACCVRVTFGIASREHADDNVSSRDRTRRD